jgi:hypothetical protein
MQSFESLRMSGIQCDVRAGSLDLKMPEPTKTPSAVSCIISAASAGGGDATLQGPAAAPPQTGACGVTAAAAEQEIPLRCQLYSSCSVTRLKLGGLSI